MEKTSDSKGKVNVRLVAMGNIINELDSFQITHWKSHLFSIEKEVKRGFLPLKAGMKPWAYSDVQLDNAFSQINNLSKADITFYILDAPIQYNYLSRILSENRIVLTYYQAKEMLERESIPLENYILSHIYAYVLLFLAKANKTIGPTDELDISHDYREGCLFDMCGVKQEVIYKCVQPIICERCKTYLINHGVTRDDIIIAEREQKKLKRSLYNRIVRKMKSYPVMTFILSCWLAIIMSVIANCFTGCYEISCYPLLIIWLAITAVCILGTFISKIHINF